MLDANAATSSWWLLTVGGAPAAAPKSSSCSGTIPRRRGSINVPAESLTRVDRHAVCGGADFFTRKDFDPTLGLTVLIIGALVSGAFCWFGRDLIACGILAQVR
jgi:hypothetical protein